jgi:Arc/MetJ-type ribon-helix-helix transcriptional regulator
MIRDEIERLINQEKDKTHKKKRMKTKLNTKINLNKFYRDEIENKIKFKRHHKQNKE